MPVMAGKQAETIENWRRTQVQRYPPAMLGEDGVPHSSTAPRPLRNRAPQGRTSALAASGTINALTGYVGRDQANHGKEGQGPAQHRRAQTPEKEKRGGYGMMAPVTPACTNALEPPTAAALNMREKRNGNDFTAVRRK
jgi:hypothetical protein